MFQPSRPPAPPRMGNNGPSTLGRVLMLVAGILICIVALLLYPSFAALNRAFVASVTTWSALVGAALLLFIGMVLVSIVLMLFSHARKIAYKADQAAVIKLTNGMPAHVGDVRAGALIATLLPRSLDQHYEQLLEEKRRPFPQLHSFAQHMHNTHAPALPAPELVSGPPPASIPSFAQLLDQGQIGPGRPLILGYRADTGAPLTGSWKDLYSCGVGAQQGAGKSWLLAFLLAQSAAAGGRLIICDLHAGDDESLANRIGALAPAFMMDIASTPKEIEIAFAFADDKLERRKGNSARWPIVIVADEWTSLLRTSAGANLPAHIQNIAEQGRKFNVNGILAAQAWTKDASSPVRNQLTSHYVLRQRPDEARYQLGLKSAQLPDDIRNLPDATAYLLNVKGELIKVIIPQMTPADIARVGELIDVPARSPAKFGFTLPTAPLTPLVANCKPDGSQMVASDNQATTASQTAKVASPEAARAASLFLSGKSPAEITAELRGVKSNQGRAYQTALNEITELIRQGVQS